MKISILFPKTETLNAFLKKQEKQPFSYPEVGKTASTPPKTYDIDYNFVDIGEGEQVWEKAKNALKNWEHFPFGWTKIYTNHQPIKEGISVAVLFYMFGFWWKNCARIIYTFDQKNRFGFAYGTLPDHVEKGEEVFWVQRNELRNEQGVVSYHIKAFSKPAFWGAKLTYPLSRRYQRKFVKESLAQMKKLTKI